MLAPMPSCGTAAADRSLLKISGSGNVPRRRIVWQIAEKILKGRPDWSSLVKTAFLAAGLVVSSHLHRPLQPAVCLGHRLAVGFEKRGQQVLRH